MQSGAPFQCRRRRTLTSLPDPSSWRGLSAPRHSDAFFLILFLEATWSRVPFPFWLPHRCVPRPPRHAPRGRGLRRTYLGGPRPPCHAQSRTARSAGPRFSQCGPSEARGSAGAIDLRKEVEDYLRRLVKPQPPGMPPFRTSVSLLFTAVLSRSCTSAISLAVALRRVLKAKAHPQCKRPTYRGPCRHV